MSRETIWRRLPDVIAKYLAKTFLRIICRQTHQNLPLKGTSWQYYINCLTIYTFLQNFQERNKLFVPFFPCNKPPHSDSQSPERVSQYVSSFQLKHIVQFCWQCEHDDCLHDYVLKSEVVRATDENTQLWSTLIAFQLLL